MGYAAAKIVDQGVIPIIDIAPLRNGGDKQAVAKALHDASREVGFIYVRGHGIDQADLDAARQAALNFFRAPLAQKETVRVSGAHRGWLGAGGAKMQDDAKADLKESFIWGYEDFDGEAPKDHSLRGANRWPEFMPELREAAMRYFDAAHEVAYTLMRGFALGLDLPEDFFLQTTKRPMSRASFVYYPPQPAEMGSEQFGVGPHTDFGVLTVLAQDQIGGLQVQDVHGEWIAAPPIPGTLVVNVGDLLARWTNDDYRSTPHRVVNSSGKERLSLVLAYDPEPDTMIDARQNLRPERRQIRADYLRQLSRMALRQGFRLSKEVKAEHWAVAASIATAATHASIRSVELHPFLIAFWRNLFCLVLILPIALPAGAWRCRPGALRLHVWRGIANTAAMVLLIMGLVRVPFAEATALTFAAPAFVVLGGMIVLRERPSRAHLWAAGLGFAGVLIIAPPGAGWIGSGGGLILLSAALFAASVLVARSQTLYADNMSVLFYLYLLLTVFCAPLALSVWTWPAWSELLDLFKVASFAIAAHWSATITVRMAQASTIAVYDYLRLVWGILIGWWLFGETVPSQTLVGMTLIGLAAAMPWFRWRSCR